MLPGHGYDQFEARTTLRRRTRGHGGAQVARRGGAGGSQVGRARWASAKLSVFAAVRGQAELTA